MVITCIIIIIRTHQVTTHLPVARNLFEANNYLLIRLLPRTNELLLMTQIVVPGEVKEREKRKRNMCTVCKNASAVFVCSLLYKVKS